MKFIIPILFLFGISFTEPLDVNDSDAIYRLQQVNPKSISDNWEYGGLVVKCPHYSYATFPMTDSIKNGIVIIEWIPDGCSAIGTYHTHGATSFEYVDESFSNLDTAGVQIRQYLMTPNGRIQRFMPDTRKVQLLSDTGWTYITSVDEDNWFLKLLKRNYRIDRK